MKIFDFMMGCLRLGILGISGIFLWLLIRIFFKIYISLSFNFGSFWNFHWFFLRLLDYIFSSWNTQHCMNFWNFGNLRNFKHLRNFRNLRNFFYFESLARHKVFLLIIKHKMFGVLFLILKFNKCTDIHEFEAFVSVLGIYRCFDF